MGDPATELIKIAGAGRRRSDRHVDARPSFPVGSHPRHDGRQGAPHRSRARSASARPDMKQIKSSAPTRIDLAGGTLDIWPFYLFHEHAQTLNAAISLRAHAEIDERTDGRIRLESIDTSKTVEVAQLAGSRRRPGPSAAQPARVFLPRREPDASHARRVACRRRHRRIVGAERRRLRRARQVGRPDARRREAADDCDERRSAGHQRAHRCSGLPPGLLRRRRRHRAAAGRHQRAPRSMSIPSSCSAASCWPTPAHRIFRARTTGKS